MKNFETFISESSKIENSFSIKCYDLRLSRNQNLIILVDDSYIVGTLQILKLPNEDSYKIENVVAVKGYGPLLYEYSFNYVYPNYLASYMSQTSDATKIWNKFKDRSLNESNIKVKQDNSKNRVIDFMIAGNFNLNKIQECPENIEYYCDEFQNQTKIKKIKI